MNASKPPPNIRKRLDLIEWATDKAAEGIVITDAQQPDNPIIYANMGFQRITGYSRDAIIGKNCRFLQGKDTDSEAMEIIRDAVKNHRPCVVELLNYRKDGTPFWNRLSITPLFDDTGEITHFVGVQSDVTELKTIRDELERTNRFLKSFYDNMTAELHRAKSAMESILPRKLPKSDRFNVAARFVPLTEIGGDFFDVFEIAEQVYGIMIADVTGHGIPAALLSYMSLSTFRNTAASVLSTAEVITKINDSLEKNLPSGNFISMFYMIYDAGKRQLTYTQAGHPPAFLIHGDSNRVQPLSTEDILVGVFSDTPRTYSEKSVNLSPGDKLFLYTDAVTEAGWETDEALDIDGLGAFLEEHADLEPRELIRVVYDHGLTLRSGDQYGDDVTLLCFKIC